MSILESLFVGLFGVIVVLVVLFGLSLLLRLQSALISRLTRRKSVPAPEGPDLFTPDTASALADGPVRLINVDEKTAALIMAIVCDEMGAEPEELYFRSIRALEKDAEEAEKRQ